MYLKYLMEQKNILLSLKFIKIYIFKKNQRIYFCEPMISTKHNSLHMIQKAKQTKIKIPANNGPIIDESYDYRWKASYDFKQNINKMYYTILSDRYELKDLLDNAYNEVEQIVEYLSPPIMTSLNKIVEEKKLDRLYYRKTNPRILSLMKKYQKLLTHGYFTKEVKSNKSNLQQQKIKLNLQNLTFQQAKQQILKEYSHLNHEQLTRYFKDLITNKLYFFSQNIGQEALFEEIAANISRQVNYNVYLPSMLKVIMANVNWIDRENDTASLALKIQVKVNVPGISQYPYLYDQVFKEKMKISLKTENKSNIYNQKIQFNGKKQPQTQQIKNDKTIKNQTKSQYYSDCGEFFQNVYKWLNYEKPTYIYHKRVQEFQGFIVQATISDVRVLISNQNEMSPFQMIDLYGIVQLDPIVTQMKDWVQILFERDDLASLKSLKKFLIEASPKVTIKFNLISLYKDKLVIKNNEKISLNHIRSFDAVECDGYKLAQNLMFLQTSNQRKSRYELFKFSLLQASYKWYPKQKIQSNQQTKISENNQTVQKIYEYLKISQFKLNPEKKRLNLTNKQNIIQINRRFQNQFRLIRIDIYNIFSSVKIRRDILSKKFIMTDKESQKIYYPENLKYDEMQNQLGRLKSMYKANLDNQIYLSSQIDPKYLPKYSEIGQHIYKFAQQKYRFQNYYRRILEILICQLEDQQQGLQSDSQHRSLRGKKNLQDLKEMLRNVIYNHQDAQNKGKNLANVKTDQDYHYSKAIYHFPFYKNPTPTLVLLFSSPFVLCIINLIVFFQQLALGDRLASVTALMICFIGMVAIMQKQIHSSSISSFEFLLYLMMLTPLLCLGFSLDCYLNHIQPTKELVLSSPLFWLSVLISGLGIILPGIFLLIFKCHEQYIYQKDENVQKQMEPLFLLFPGSPQVDKILPKQKPQEIGDDGDQTHIMNHTNEEVSRKTLVRVVTSLMFKHLNNLYQLRKTQEVADRETILITKLQKSIQQKKKFINNTFQKPHHQNKENVEASAKLIYTPTKQRKNK